MTQTELWMKTDLNHNVNVRDVRGNFFCQDNNGNIVGVSVFKGGVAVTLEGTVFGYIIRPDGATVIVQGIVDGNRAFITIPAQALAFPGRISIVIQLVNNETKTVLAACSGMVLQTRTDSAVDPGELIPDLTELLEKVAVCEEATIAANAAAERATEISETMGVALARLRNALKTELLQLLQNVVYTNSNGLSYYNALRDALDDTPVTLSSISAEFDAGSAVIYNTDTLSSLKQYLTVTATYSDGSTAVIASSEYTLSGTLGVGVCAIGVSYGGKTASFNVTVESSPVLLVGINAVFNAGSATIYDTDSLNTLKQYLTVTATYSDGSSITISRDDYVLSGTLSVGLCTITVSYSSQTASFTVIVAAAPVVLSSISASFDAGSATIYESTSLNDLKQYLSVTAHYSDGSTAPVSSNEYTLSGTLTVGVSTITVSYNGKTTTFNVTVSNPSYVAQVIYTNFTATGQRFSTGDISVNFAGGDYVEAIIDASSESVVNQTNLLSFAKDGSNDYLDYSTGEAVFIYKRDQSGTMKVLFRVKDTANNVSIDKWVTPDNFNNLVVRIDKNGVYLNGAAVSGISASDLAFLTNLSKIAIGARASKLSYATYSSVAVYRMQ